MKYQCLACKAADNCELSWKDPTEEYMNCTEFKAPPRTNADRIRAMTDEELAKYLAWLVDKQTCSPEWLIWLKDEVKNV